MGVVAEHVNGEGDGGREVAESRPRRLNRGGFVLKVDVHGGQGQVEQRRRTEGGPRRRRKNQRQRREEESERRGQGEEMRTYRRKRRSSWRMWRRLPEEGDETLRFTATGEELGFEEGETEIGIEGE